MKIVPQKVELLTVTKDALALIEAAGRTCYKSEEKITPESAEAFVRKIVKRGHDSVLEHASMTVRITTDRGISHEIVRHRIGMSYSQESTRFVKYAGEMEFIKPQMKNSDALQEWEMVVEDIEEVYHVLISQTAPEHARSILPNSLKTEIVVTGNFRAWRHFIKLRTAAAAHPQIREIAGWIKDLLPAVIVEDL